MPIADVRPIRQLVASALNATTLEVIICHTITFLPGARFQTFKDAACEKTATFFIWQQHAKTHCQQGNMAAAVSAIFTGKEHFSVENSFVTAHHYYPRHLDRLSASWQLLLKLAFNYYTFSQLGTRTVSLFRETYHLYRIDAHT